MRSGAVETNLVPFFAGNFKRRHCGVVPDWNKGEEQFPLGVRIEALEGPGNSDITSAGVLENVKIVQQYSSITINVEHPTSDPSAIST